MGLGEEAVVRTLIALSFLLTAACASESCRKVERKEKQKMMQPVKVFKYDGSKQCEPNTGTTLEKMAIELDGIEILSSETKNDGRMRVQMCGTPTGQAHIFEIASKDLEEAKKRGFEVWSFDK